MQRHRTSTGLESRQLFAGGFLLGVYVFVLALAHSGPLHRHFHVDACNPEHECVVTLLTSGQIDAPAHDLPLAPVLTVWVGPCQTNVSVLPVARQFLQPNRGPPPAFLLNTVVG